MCLAFLQAHYKTQKISEYSGEVTEGVDGGGGGDKPKVFL